MHVVDESRCCTQPLLHPSSLSHLGNPRGRGIPYMYIVYMGMCHCIEYGFWNSCAQRPRSFWSAPRIKTSHYQIFEHAQCSYSVVFSQSDLSDLNNESINRGLPVLGAARGLDSRCWPKGSRPLGTRMGFWPLCPELGT